MTNRCDLLAVSEGKDGKTYFNRVGVAFQSQNDPNMWTIRLFAVPAAKDGEVKMLMKPPLPREKRPQQAPQGQYGGNQGAPQQDTNDGLPDGW